MKLAIAIAVVVLALVAAPTAFAQSPVQAIPDDGSAVTVPQHDASCLISYAGTTPSSPPTFWLFNPGEEVDDDAHTTLTTNASLCAFDILVLNLDVAGGTHDVVITLYTGGPADPVPGAVTAGPFTVTIPAVSGNQLLHVEAASGYVTPDCYFGYNDLEGKVPIRAVVSATVGTTHDLWYFPSSGFQSGSGRESIYAVLYTSPPVPVNATTWGAVKASYR